MNLKCLIGMHEWSGCKCKKCGKIRDESHDWAADCEKCAKCGKTRPGTHSWAGCKCTVCGKTRDEGHDWAADCEKCAKCGETRTNEHDWSSDCKKCAKCGKTRSSEHDWSSDCEKCAECSKTRSNRHKWDGCNCTECGQDRHQWKNCRCSRCSTLDVAQGYGDRVKLSGRDLIDKVPQIELALLDPPELNFERAKKRCNLFIEAGQYGVMSGHSLPGKGSLETTIGEPTPLACAIALDIQNHCGESAYWIARCQHDILLESFRIWYEHKDESSRQLFVAMMDIHAPYCNWWYSHLFRDWPPVQLAPFAHAELGTLMFLVLQWARLRIADLLSGPLRFSASPKGYQEIARTLYSIFLPPPRSQDHYEYMRSSDEFYGYLRRTGIEHFDLAISSISSLSTKDHAVNAACDSWMKLKKKLQAIEV